MCVYILLSLLNEVYSLIIGEISVKRTKYLSFSLVRGCSPGSFQKIRSQKSSKFTTHQISLTHSFIICVQKKASDWWWESFVQNPPFLPREKKKRVQFKSKSSLLCVSYITEEISDRGGRGQKMSTRHLDYDPDRRARESGREEAEVLDARRLVYVEPWYRKLWRCIHFFLINLFLLYWCVFCAALAVVFCRYFTYVFALGATAVALGAVIVNSSRK